MPHSLRGDMGHPEIDLFIPLFGVARISRPPVCFRRLLSNHPVHIHVSHRILCCAHRSKMRTSRPKLGLRQPPAGARQPWTSCTPLLSAASAHHTGHFGARLLGAITLEPRCNTSRQFRHNTNAILKIFLVQKGPLLMHECDERAFTIWNVG